MSKTLRIVLAVSVVVALVGGAGWWFILRDKSDPVASLDAINPTGSTAAGPAKTSPDGAWKVQAGEDVFVGYRVHEIFAAGAIEKTANGRSAGVTGTMTVAGGKVTAVEITADTTKLKSDETRRDGQITDKGLETKKFPQATFKLTQPIDAASVQQGTETPLSATGDLTLHGVTKSVTVPLNAKWTGSAILIATVGEGLPIVMADYGITPIEVPGFVKTDDHGTLELQLLFVPA